VPAIRWVIDMYELPDMKPKKTSFLAHLGDLIVIGMAVYLFLKELTAR